MNIFAGGGTFGARSAAAPQNGLSRSRAHHSLGQLVLATNRSAVMTIQNDQKRAFDLYYRNEALPLEFQVPRSQWRTVGDAGDALNVALVVPYTQHPDAPMWTDPPPATTVQAVSRYDRLVSEFELAVLAAEQKSAAAPTAQPQTQAAPAPAEDTAAPFIVAAVAIAAFVTAFMMD